MKRNLLYFYIFSILLHGIVYFSLSSISWRLAPQISIFKKNVPSPQLNLTRIQFKTVGIKNGKKNNFTPPQKKTNKSSIVKNSENFLKELSKNKTNAKKINNKMATSKKRLPTSKKILRGNLNDLITNYLPQNVFPKNSGLSIQVETPEGVSIDKLNSLELKFFNFNKRHFNSLSSAIYRTYSEFNFRNPHINFFKLGKQITTARVVFYPNGRIDEIKFLEFANDNNFQNFFQDTIESLKLPNPPEELLIDGKFHVLYSFLLDN